MALRFGINGLGRIGRALIRIAATRPELGLELAAANDSADPRQVARLLRHDTVHGTFPVEVAAGEGTLILAGRPVPLSGALTPQRRSTGRRPASRWSSRRRGGSAAARSPAGTSPTATAHCARWWSRRRCPILISRSAWGSTTATSTPRWRRVISNASCTTNCLAPLLLVPRPRLRRRPRADEYGALRNQQPEHRRQRARRSAPRALGARQHHSDDLGRDPLDLSR